jgi:predicted GH43/DUF377 family glycosyl hydrolase
MNNLRIHRSNMVLNPECSRVILRPFIPTNPLHISHIIQRALALGDDDIKNELKHIYREFEDRHFDLEGVLMAHYNLVLHYVFSQTQLILSHERKLLIGALFSGEYSVESAALFNPSIVPHPDQNGVPIGGLRFIMSLRATGEGHISSIEFRSGYIHPGGKTITLDPLSPLVGVPDLLPDPSYQKKRFIRKMESLGFTSEATTLLLDSLPEHFTKIDLIHHIETLRSKCDLYLDLPRFIDSVQWLADSNYEVRFSPKLALNERIIFPVSRNESNGIEDARFVQFTEDDGSISYYATYTAYNGIVILPQFIETEDFLHFRIVTLHGKAIQNKGMALFPRKINGKYAMLSRQDDENLMIMFSDSLHHWSHPQTLLNPSETWEIVKIGNAGSPLETEAGWLVITHGVGPMRKYCLGAILLKLDDPTVVLGRLKEPFLFAEGKEREGYVPNVVYSCGALIHNRHLILPYALSDKLSSILSIPLEDLLSKILHEPN